MGAHTAGSGRSSRTVRCGPKTSRRTPPRSRPRGCPGRIRGDRPVPPGRVGTDAPPPRGRSAGAAGGSTGRVERTGGHDVTASGDRRTWPGSSRSGSYPTTSRLSANHAGHARAISASEGSGPRWRAAMHHSLSPRCTTTSPADVGVARGQWSRGGAQHPDVGLGPDRRGPGYPAGVGNLGRGRRTGRTRRIGAGRIPRIGRRPPLRLGHRARGIRRSRAHCGRSRLCVTGIRRSRLGGTGIRRRRLRGRPPRIRHRPEPGVGERAGRGQDGIRLARARRPPGHRAPGRPRPPHRGGVRACGEQSRGEGRAHCAGGIPDPAGDERPEPETDDDREPQQAQGRGPRGEGGEPLVGAYRRAARHEPSRRGGHAGAPAGEHDGDRDEQQAARDHHGLVDAV